MDHYADDLAVIIQTLDLSNVVLVGHSTGGGEVARYIGRHGISRVSKAVLISAVTPLMLQTPSNPEGVPMEFFDGFRKALLADRSGLYRSVASGPFYGFNRPGAKMSQGFIESFWMQGMLSGYKGSFDCIKAFSETDFTEDLKKFNIPTLILHGDDDQVVPIKATAMKAAELVKGAQLKIYQGADHGMCSTHKDRVNADLLQFIKGD